MRSQNSQSHCCTKLENHIKLIFNRCFVISGLILITLFLLMLISNVTSAAVAVEEGQTVPQGIQAEPNVSQRFDLLRVEISAPKDQRNEEGKNKLKRLIEQVRSVQFKSVPHNIAVPDANDEAPVPELNEVLPRLSPPKTEKAEEVKIEQPYDDGHISDRTLKVLKDLLQHPDKLKDPLELGEILFSSGKMKDAVFFYEEALKRTDPNEVHLSQERAWILFQLGNCLRIYELPAAADIYRKILIEYPDCPWADLAKAQKDLIEWRLKEKPYELIVEPTDRGRRKN